MDNLYSLNLSHLSNEMCLLLSLIGESSHDRQWEKEKIDWQVFLHLAQHHRVYPIAYKKLKEHNASWVPSFVLQTLCQKVKKNTLWMLHLSRETEIISNLFAENKVKSLFLKGPTLAHDLYGDVSLRTSSDLDIMVPITDLDKINTLLIERGYIKDNYIKTVLRDWKWRHHHVTYFNSSRNIKLEIHWRLNPGPSREPAFDELWKRKRISKLTQTPIYILGKEDLFLFLASHGARHGWSRLRWLLDIKYLYHQQLDWNVIRKLLERNYYLPIGRQSLILVSKLLGTNVNSGISTIKDGSRSYLLAQRALYYLENEINLHDEELPSDIAQYHKHYLFALMSWQQKWLFILSLLYPYPMDKETLPLPKILHFLYFPLRPFLTIWRKIRKQVLPQGD